MNTLYGEVRPGGHFRFVNFGHPPPLVFSAEYRKFAKIDEDRMVQFLALGLQIPADHPDRRKYYSMNFRQREFNSSDIAEITLMSPGDILVLYTDRVYDGSDEQMCEQLEAVLRKHYWQPGRDICNALLEYAVKQDDLLRQNSDETLIDDKTVFIVKRT
jgi:serine phosphatase RsbU (regulator of sigma subunit)